MFRRATRQPTPTKFLASSIIFCSPLEQSPLEQSPLEQSPLEQSPLEQSPLEQSPLEYPAFRLLALQQMRVSAILRA